MNACAMSAPTILVTGEALADFLPLERGRGRRFEVVLGGSGFNAALALARGGVPVAYRAALSHDGLGREFRARLAQEGIDQRFIVDSALPTPLSLIDDLAADGSASYRIYLDGTAWTQPLPPPPDFAGFVHLHATSFDSVIGHGGEAAPRLMAAARSGGASISYDVNVRSALLPERREALRLVETRVALADIVKASTEDLDWLCPGIAPSEVATHWLRCGARLVLITDGGAGAVCHGAGEPLAIPAPAVAVVDTVGAGDCFVGGFLAAMAGAGHLGAGLPRVTRPALSDALAFACAVAAESCTRPGCDPSHRRPDAARREADG